MKKHATARPSLNRNLLCAAALVSVILNMVLTTPARAGDMGGDSSASPASAAAVAPSAGTSGNSGLPQGVVARVNGVDIPQAQLEDVLRASQQPDTLQVRQTIRQSLIARELFRQNAERLHYDTKPEV